MDFDKLQIASLNLTEKEAEILIREMMSYYDEAITNITNELSKQYGKYLTGVRPEDYYKTMLLSNRLEKLLEYSQGQYNYYAKLINEKIIQTSSLSLSNNWYRQNYANSFMAGISFSVLDPRIIEVSVLGTKESWKKINESIQGKYLLVSDMAPQYGSLTESILDPFKRDVLAKIQRTMTGGFIQGLSLQKMSKSISNVMDNARWQADRIARTESSRTANEAIQLSAIDAANKGARIKRMWVSALDDRTRAKHANLDGQLADVDKPFKISGESVMRPGAWSSIGDNINERCRTVNTPILADGTPDIPRFRRGYPPITDPKTGKTYSKAGQSQVYEMKYFDQWAKENNLKKNKYGEYYA